MGASFDATQAEVKQVETEFLAKLQDIREAMVQGGNGGGGVSSSDEMKALQAENEALKKLNTKLNYRVRHMLKTMNELYDQQKKNNTTVVDV